MIMINSPYICITADNLDTIQNNCMQCNIFFVREVVLAECFEGDISRCQ